jgi:hypothetical protein
MGRHVAGSGPPHPLVAAALAERPPGTTARHLRFEGGLGWPGSPNDGRGLGWPGDPTGDAGPTSARETAPAPVPRWRRLLGLGRAA